MRFKICLAYIYIQKPARRPAFPVLAGTEQSSPVTVLACERFWIASNSLRLSQSLLTKRDVLPNVSTAFPVYTKIYFSRFIQQSRNAIVSDGQTYESRLYMRFKYMFSIYLNTKAGTEASVPSFSWHGTVFACHSPCLRISISDEC